MSKATLEEFYRSTLRAHYKTAMYRGKSLYEWAVIWFTHSNDSFFDMYGFNFNPHNYSGLYGIVREDLVAHATVRLIDHKVKVGLRGVSL